MKNLDLEDLKDKAEALIAHSAACEDARTWGGPTIYPPPPLRDHEFRHFGLAVLSLIEEFNDLNKGRDNTQNPDMV